MWEERRLENIVDFIDGDRGVNYPKQNEIFENGYRLFLNTSNVTNQGFNFQNNNFITKEKDEILRKGKLKREDIVLTTRGTIGNIAYYSNNIKYEHVRINSGMVLLRLKDETNNVKYLYQLFKSQYVKTLMQLFSSGSAQPQLPIKDLKRVKIQLPTLHAQQKIAGILSAYDDLIENNNRRIELLEQAAQQLYKEWFVRFRFPNYNSAHFEMGIPRGWKIKRLIDFGRIETGKTPPTSNLNNYDGNIMFIKTPDMHGNVYVVETEEYLTEIGHKTQPNKLLPANTISVSCIGTGGIVAINAQPAHTNQQINSIILDDIKYLEWLYFTVKALKPTIEMFGATGATMTNLSKGKFEKLKVVCPTIELVNNFNQLTSPILKEIKELLFYNQNLIKQRDLLLPRLMSGKIEV